MWRSCFFVMVLVLPGCPSGGTEFHLDPAAGSLENDGSAAHPWPGLQAVVDAGLIASQEWESLPYNNDSTLVPKHPDAPVQPGDTLWLRSGYYGDLNITGHYNTGEITVAAAPGAEPRFRSVRVRSCANWRFKGLHISPEYGEGEGTGTMFDLDSHGWQGPVFDISVEDCVLETAADTSAWTAEDWNKRAWNGFNVDGERMTLRGNRLKNVDFGIGVSAAHSLVEHNVVENFSGDGMRGLGDYTVFQYNLVKNCYDVNANHDDGFQSWSSTSEGVGKGEVAGVVLRGNTIINNEDPKQPHRGTLQGIGCFDGMYVDWLIENNVVIVDHYHGITLLGAKNCRFINNTVIDALPGKPGAPWIQAGKHKNGTLPTGCILRNNLAPSVIADNPDEATVDHNVIVEYPDDFFVDPAVFDLHLKEGCAAIDAGSPDLAPKTDMAGTIRPQGRAVDAGAFEYK